MSSWTVLSVPSSAMNFPATQFEQDAEAGLSLYFPEGQIVHADDSVAVAAFVNFFPIAHAVQEADNSPEYFPTPQMLQEADDSPEYSPATQSVHADDSDPVAAFVNFFPAAHAVHEVDDSPEYFPAPQ